MYVCVHHVCEASCMYVCMLYVHIYAFSMPLDLLYIILDTTDSTTYIHVYTYIHVFHATMCVLTLTQNVFIFINF